MAQVILIESDITRNDIYSLNLRTYLGADLIPKKNHEEAIELLSSHSSIDIIITRNIVDNEKTALLIHKFLRMSGRTVPMVVLGPEPLLEKYAIILAEDVEVKVLIKTCATCLGITPREMVMKEVDDYFMIPVFYFMALENFICDVYVKVHNQQDYHFAKKFAQGNKVDLQEVQVIIKKGVKNLYIPKEYRLKFTNEVTVGLSQKLKSESLSDEERIKFNESSMEVVKEQVKTVGFSEEAVELTWTSIDSVKRLVVTSPGLKLLLDKLLSNKSSFQYKHCQIITYISYHAIELLHWGGGEQQKLMGFVSFFHDICLGRDELAKIDNEEKLLKSGLSDLERGQVRNHALEAARLIQDFPRAPMSAEMIIKQHHGAIGGIGFPKIFSNNISPLAIVFIIAEEFANHILLEKSLNTTKGGFFEYLYRKYPRSMYRKVISSLERLEY